MTPRSFIGIDVGTGSARAGVFDAAGEMLGSAKTDIAIYREAGSIVEHSSTNIWQSVCASVRAALQASGVDPDRIGGIGFDATCSLVVLGAGGQPLPVGPSEDPTRDVIVWMDHRATDQARRINAMGHDVLRYVGGVISPEMQTPKLLWLAEHRPDTFAKAWQFLDLADFLTWKSTGSLARSVCTVTCKWTYLAHEKRWDAGYFRAVGLGVLADEDFVRIGTEIVDAGTALGRGLTPTAAADLGLPAGTPVAAGLIDAHAGGIGTVGSSDAGPVGAMAYVFGTSSCTMTSTVKPTFMPGVWGPYYSAMAPGLWLNEGGQSAAGAAIDRLIAMHPAAQMARDLAGARPLPVWLADRAMQMVTSASDVVELARGLHVLPEFLGNRAPFADPDARAVIAGLGMQDDLESLVALYIASLCGVAYGLRQIVEVQAAHAAPVSRIMISGGAGQHDLIRQLLADATGLSVMATRASEPVLLGSAMLGAVAGGAFPVLTDAMSAMSSVDRSYSPATGPIAQLHDARFRAFGALQTTARTLRDI